MPNEPTALAQKRRARKIFRVLEQTYPYAVAELDFRNPFELLVATVLSAQTTDVRVNSVTPELFASYPDAHALAAAERENVERIIRSLGFFRAKTQSIISLAQSLVVGYDGVVPATMNELTRLAGVGRKTANVVLGNAFDVPGLTVDTHFGRLARRMGFSDHQDPVKVEQDVLKLFKPQDLTTLSHVMVYHGRRMCHAKRPACGACPVARWCPSYGIGERDPEQARALLAYELAPGREELLEKMRAGMSRAQLKAQGYSLTP